MERYLEEPHSAVLCPPARVVPTLRPYAEWPLEVAVDIDCHTPSFLVSSFYQADTKRQAVFSVLAELKLGTPPERLAASLAAAAPGVCGNSGLSALAQIGRALVVLDARRITQSVFGSAPDGLLGTMKRLGHEVAGSPEWYRELPRLFSSKDVSDRARLKVLATLEGAPLRPSQIEAVTALDPLLLHRKTVEKLSGAEDALRLNSALTLIKARCSAAGNAALRQSLEAMGGNLEQWVSGWVQSFDRLPHPDLVLPEGGPDLRVLRTGAEMMDAGRRFRNCLGTRRNEVALGRYLYLEHNPALEGSRGAVVELRRTTAGWIIEGLYAEKNRTVPKALAAALRAKLRRAGVASYATAPGMRNQLEGAASWLDLSNFFELESEMFAWLDEPAHGEAPALVAA